MKLPGPDCGCSTCVRYQWRESMYYTPPIVDDGFGGESLMDSAMLQKLDVAVDDFAAKWSAMFHRCSNCGAEVPAADVRQKFAAELKPLLGDVIAALHSDVDTLTPAETAEKAERDALTAAQLAGATVEAVAVMQHPESEADRVERDALTSAAAQTEGPDAGETVRTGG